MQFRAGVYGCEHVACRDGSLSRLSNAARQPGCRTRPGVEQEARGKHHVLLSVWDPEDRLRYPPFSLFFMIWLVETVRSSVQAILLFSRGVEADPVTNGQSGKTFTFWSISLDLENRLRYPPVSLFFGMCWWSWTRLRISKICLADNFAGPRSVLVVGFWWSDFRCWFW